MSQVKIAEIPYEVLSGVAVRDRSIWPLIRDLSDSQKLFFGMRLFEAYGSEAKAKKLLKNKVFKSAARRVGIRRSSLGIEGHQ